MRGPFPRLQEPGKGFARSVAEKSEVVEFFFLVVVEVVQVIVVIVEVIILVVDIDLVDLQVFLVEVFVVVDIVEIIIVVDIVDIVIIVIKVVIDLFVDFFLVAGMAGKERRDEIAELEFGRLARDRVVSDHGQASSFPHRSVLKDWG
jgi:hypothetical protein